MPNEPKYPNANTSPERLAEIERQMHGDVTQEEFVAYAAKKRKFSYDRGYSDDFVKFYDLLAMLHERADYKHEYEKVVEAASVFQSGGELAGLVPLGHSTTLDGPKVAAKEIARLKAELHEQRWRRVDLEPPPSYTLVYCQTNEDTGHEFWRPIPPLPKE